MSGTSGTRWTGRVRTGRSPGAKPQPVITGADVDVGLDLVTTRATTGVEPMRVLGEAIAQVVTDSDHGRKPDALARIIGDGLFNRLAHHGARIRRDPVDTEPAAFRNLIDGDSRNRR